ncbi:hypothetical protein CHARACLAT_014823 [Characodon lateralis]|uniref:Uncharacterized protein n=1 Tax=Characodon lateralis TaxID=208331 RepID=A0ABU7DGP0_9TELE|nr:hypothetical protein [Characodon lateralis]
MCVFMPAHTSVFFTFFLLLLFLQYSFLLQNKKSEIIHTLQDMFSARCISWSDGTCLVLFYYLIYMLTSSIFALHHGSPTPVLESYSPAAFKRIPASTHLNQMNGSILGLSQT